MRAADRVSTQGVQGARGAWVAYTPLRTDTAHFASGCVARKAVANIITVCASVDACVTSFPICWQHSHCRKLN